MSVSDATETSSPLKLRDFADLSVLEQMQACLAAMGLSVSVIDGDGEILTSNHAGNEFCRLATENPNGRQLCAQVHAQCLRHGNRTMRLSKCRNCPAGLTHLVAPIMIEGRPAGTIVIGGYIEDDFDEASIRDFSGRISAQPERLIQAARTLADRKKTDPTTAAQLLQLTTSVTATLFYQQRQLRQRLYELRVVYKISNVLSGPRDLQDVLNETVRLVTEVMGAKACSIRLLDPASGELHIKAVHNLSKEYVEKGKVPLSKSLINVAALSGQVVYVRDMRTDERVMYRDHAAREGIVSSLTAPLIYRNNRLGVLRIYTDHVHEFSEEQVSLLQAVAAQAAAAITNAQLYEQSLQAELMNRQIRTAREIQRRMVPSRPPSWPGLEIGTAYSPCFELGGDFYDFIIADGKLVVAMADVVGKGVPASLLMASLRASLRAVMDTKLPISEVVGRLNRLMFEDVEVGEFATLLVACFDSEGRRVTYTNAGHEPWLWYHNGQIQPLQVGGLILGVDADARYEQQTIQLHSGDVLVAYTDGLTDTMNFEGEPFGRQRTLQAVTKYVEGNAEQTAKNILWEMRRFAGLAKRFDDTSIVVVKAV